MVKTNTFDLNLLPIKNETSFQVKPEASYSKACFIAIQYFIIYLKDCNSGIKYRLLNRPKFGLLNVDILLNFILVSAIKDKLPFYGIYLPVSQKNLSTYFSYFFVWIVIFHLYFYIYNRTIC